MISNGKKIMVNPPQIISLGVNQRASYRWVSRTGEVGDETLGKYKEVKQKSEYEEVMDAQDAIDKLKP